MAKIKNELPLKFDVAPDVNSKSNQTTSEGKFRGYFTQGTLYNTENGENQIVSSTNEKAASAVFMEVEGKVVLERHQSLGEEKFPIEPVEFNNPIGKSPYNFTVPFNDALLTPIQRADTRYEAERAEREAMSEVVGDPTIAFARLVEDIPVEILAKYFPDDI